MVLELLIKAVCISQCLMKTDKLIYCKKQTIRMAPLPHLAILLPKPISSLVHIKHQMSENIKQQSLSNKQLQCVYKQTTVTLSLHHSFSSVEPTHTLHRSMYL